MRDRERSTGRYGWGGDNRRLCTCGHPLAVHLAEPPHACADADRHMDGATGSPCTCARFRLARGAR